MICELWCWGWGGVRVGGRVRVMVFVGGRVRGKVRVRGVIGVKGLAFLRG